PCRPPPAAASIERQCSRHGSTRLRERHSLRERNELEGGTMKKLLPVLGAIAAVGVFMSTASAAPVTTAAASSAGSLRLPRATPAGQTTACRHIRYGAP